VTDKRRIDHPKGNSLARPNAWAGKVLTLLRGGNTAAAIAQIKVAPSAADVQALRKAMAAAQLEGRWREVDLAVDESIAALSAPRLHRSP
jgi:hypothetical protein